VATFEQLGCVEDPNVFDSAFEPKMLGATLFLLSPDCRTAEKINSCADKVIEELKGIKPEAARIGRIDNPVNLQPSNPWIERSASEAAHEGRNEVSASCGQ
jgi:hypothetical protein